jgi:hypothetical protein
VEVPWSPDGHALPVLCRGTWVSAGVRTLAALLAACLPSIARPTGSTRTASLARCTYVDGGRLRPALPGSDILLLLLVAFGCNVAISGLGQAGQHESTTKETPMKVTKKARSQKIFKITLFGFLATVAIAAVGAATSV